MVSQDTSKSCFNTHTRVGCDDKLRLKLDEIFQFQYTHPCRVRSHTHSAYTGRRRFNTHTRVGCDTFFCSLLPTFLFQYTHPCRVRFTLCAPPLYFRSFNTHTRVGCDRPVRKPRICWPRKRKIANHPSNPRHVRHICGDMDAVKPMLTICTRSRGLRLKIANPLGVCTELRVSAGCA